MVGVFLKIHPSTLDDFQGMGRMYRRTELIGSQFDRGLYSPILGEFDCTSRMIHSSRSIPVGGPQSRALAVELIIQACSQGMLVCE